MGVRFAPECLSALKRNGCPFCSGFCTDDITEQLFDWDTKFSVEKSNVDYYSIKVNTTGNIYGRDTLSNFVYQFDGNNYVIVK